MRSPNYPAVGLSEAVSLATSVWGREKRSYAPIGAIVQAWGYSGLSGNARTKIAALKKYGLLEENANGDLRLSERAVHILHNPTDSPEQLLALREAALSPELFAELQVTYPHGSNETIRSYLITKKGFTDTGADACVKAFRDTQETAKLAGMEATTSAPQPPTLQVQPKADMIRAEDTANIERKSSQATLETVFRWPLSRGVVAEVRFIGDTKPAHLDLLKQYLDVAKGAMEIDEEKPVSHRVSSAPEDATHEPE